jgi:transcriptional regulator with XRE-family HTH domain
MALHEPRISAPYSPEENAKLRAAVAGFMESKGWPQRRVAIEMGLLPQTLSAFLGGKNGAGTALVRAFSKLVGRTEAELLADPSCVSAPASARTDWPPLRTLPGWADAVAEARKVFRPPVHVYETIGNLRGPPPADVSARTVGQLAELWWMQSEKEEVSASIKRQRRAARAATTSELDGLPPQGDTLAPKVSSAGMVAVSQPDEVDEAAGDKR